jgi:hypothetical protein
MGRVLKQYLMRTIVILLLVVSIPVIIIGISSSNIPVVSTIFHNQQAMAQNMAIPTTMPNFLEYHNSTYGINVQYPSDWLYKGSKISNDSVQGIVTFASPNVLTSSSSNKSVVVLTIGIENLPFYNIPLNLYTNLTINNLRESEPGFRLLASNEISLAGIKPAHRIIFTSDNMPNTMAVYAVKGDKAYVIDYIAGSEATYSNYLPIARKMIDSFQIVNINAKAVTASNRTNTNANIGPANQNNNNNTSSSVQAPCPYGLPRQLNGVCPIIPEAP